MRKAPLYILLILGAAACLVPLAWTVSTALKTRQQGYAAPPEWIPRSPRLTLDGRDVPVAVVSQITGKAAAVVRLQSGRVIPVEKSAILPAPTTTRGQSNPKAEPRTDPNSRDPSPQSPVPSPQPLASPLRVKLPAAPDPVPAELVKDMPDGVAQVRTWPDGPHPSQELFVAPSELRFVFDPQWRNFYPPDPTNIKQRREAAWTALPLQFHWFVLNTFTITIINILAQTISCSLVAYGFARFSFRGRKGLFLLLLSTLMLPAQVTMIPVYMMWKTVGLTDTFGPLTIPAFFAQNAFFVFLLRQFFMQIPRELDEAAMIDGCGPLRIWWQVILPLSKPAITTVAVLSFIGHWDDFFGPLIYLNSMENYTVSLALRLFQDQNSTDFHLLMAAALVHIIPVVILFFIAQRYFVKGIAMTGLKA